MTYPLVKFVDKPDVAATVRLDLNDATATAPRRIEGEFDLGVPTLEGDPDAIGQVFGFRSLRFTVQVGGTKANALAFVSALSKELLRRTNWVMFQLNAATSPVWFKTYRTGYEPLSLEEVYATPAGGAAPAGFADRWRVVVPLLAEPFAYGARVTQPSATFGSSLAATNPMRLALPAIKGDAPTKLRLTLNPTTGAVGAARLALVSADATVVDPVLDIGTGDGFSAGTGTAAGTANAAALGGTWRVVTIGAGANLLTRLSGTVTPAAAGRYKVLLRCEADPISGTVPNRYSFSFGQVSASTTVFAPATVVDTPAYNGFLADTYRGWVDLGDFTFPRGVNAPVDITGAQPASSWALKIGTPAGVAGTVRLDALKLVPIDGPTIRSTTQLFTGPNLSFDVLAATSVDAINWDGDTEAFWRHLVATGALQGDLPAFNQRGAYLTADPAAAQNLLITLLDGTISSATGVWTVVVSYYPRYLHIGDGT